VIASVVFDLDGTLAPIGEGVSSENLALLKQIEEKGVHIALSSGKPTFYLCGFARQMGLKKAVLIGENGGALQVGVDLPPKIAQRAAVPPLTREALRMLREKLESAFPDRIWYQPNETALTPFPAYQEDFPPIRNLIREFLTPEMELSVYEHPDCFDIVYALQSKATGIELLCRVLGIRSHQIIAVGDWTNDYPMFRAAGYSVGISLPDPEKASVCFDSLHDALVHILEKIGENGA